MPAFPFSVELHESDGNKIVVGTVADRALAWRYYAAIRTYPDGVVLREYGTALGSAPR
jgi:hypothetical protein